MRVVFVVVAILAIALSVEAIEHKNVPKGGIRSKWNNAITKAGDAIKYGFDYVAKSFSACNNGETHGFCVAQCSDVGTIEMNPGQGRPCGKNKVCCDIRVKSEGAENNDDDYNDDESSAPAPEPESSPSADVSSGAEDEASAAPAGCDLTGYNAPFDCGDRYARGTKLGPAQCIKLKVGQNTGKSDVSITTSLICPLLKLIKGAKDAGISRFNINSGFRTMAEQQALRRKNCRGNKCRPATAPAGASNHQNGIAVDIEVNANPALYRWLSNNAAKFGFIRAVPSETWHWEYRPGSKCNAIVKYACKN